MAGKVANNIISLAMGMGEIEGRKLFVEIKYWYFVSCGEAK